MKVLIAFHSLNNLGGIINNQEGLYAGLRVLGHTVVVRRLEWKGTARAGKATDMGRIVGEQGMRYDQIGGWVWPLERRFAYKGKENLERWKTFAMKFDLIIWQIPVPTRQKSNFGNLDWLELYDVPVKQVAYIHDGNFKKQYPWLYAVRKHLTGVVGVHPCAYNSLSLIDVPRAMAFSPQIGIESLLDNTSYAERSPGFLSLQTFKAWKHVGDLVRAVPYMHGVSKKLLAGGGLHYYYMTSKNKLKPEYKVSPKLDPDIQTEYIGRRVWEVAQEHGMKYLGYIHNDRRDRLLSKLRLLVDPSWSHTLAKQGDHFNRVVIDGIIRGCVPVARNLGISTNELGKGELFKADENYIMVPWNASPKEFGEIVSEAVGMGDKKYKRLLSAGRALLKHFDYRVTAQTFVDIAQGKPAGFYKKKEVGTYNKALQVACDLELNSFFSGRVVEKRGSDDEEPEGALF